MIERKGRQVLTGTKPHVHFNPSDSEHMELASLILKQHLTKEEHKQKAEFPFQFILENGFTHVPAMLNHAITNWAFDIHRSGCLRNVKILPARKGVAKLS
jgi:hypothetical protein